MTDDGEWEVGVVDHGGGATTARFTRPALPAVIRRREMASAVVPPGLTRSAWPDHIRQRVHEGLEALRTPSLISIAPILWHPSLCFAFAVAPRGLLTQ